MPMIYKRFTDKTAEEWRQIYKVPWTSLSPKQVLRFVQSLQLLEFLVKNGSERVIDDARSHLSLLRMLRQFHFIDQNGKDQGINVRNRAQELAKLLSDVDAIRAERKKSRANRNKFGGVEGGMGLSGGLSSGSRYGGFGSEDASYGSYGGRVYGDGGGFGGTESGFSDTQRRSDRFEEYDEDEEGGGTTERRRENGGVRAASINTIKRDAGKKVEEKKKKPEQDLFDFGDEEVASPPAIGGTTTSGGLDDFGTLQSSTTDPTDDDFDDFQSATPATPANSIQPALSSLSPPPPTTTFTTTSSTQFAAPKPVAPSNLNDLFSNVSSTPISTASATPLSSAISSPPPAPQAQPLIPRSTGPVQAQPNYFTSVQTQATPSVAPSATSFSSTASRPGVQSTSSFSSTSAATLGKPTATSNPTKPAGRGDAFGSLWSTASAGAGIQNKQAASSGPNLSAMAKAKSDASMWGAPTAPTPQQARPSNPTPRTAATGGGALDDLMG